MKTDSRVVLLQALPRMAIGLAKQYYAAACTITDSGTHSHPVSRSINMYLSVLSPNDIYMFQTCRDYYHMTILCE